MKVIGPFKLVRAKFYCSVIQYREINESKAYEKVKLSNLLIPNYLQMHLVHEQIQQMHQAKPLQKLNKKKVVIVLIL